MATCYEDLIGSWKNNNSNGAAFLDGTNTRVYEQWSLNMLYSWHIADPVSRKEEDRNNVIYSVQGNRNPFIDHPEWVYSIWSSALSNENFNFLEGVSVYPNPSSNGAFSITSKTILDDIQLISINGQLIYDIKNPIKINESYTLDNLPQGFYFLKLTSDTDSVIKKISVN